MVNSRVNHLVKLVQRALNLSSPFAVLHYVAISNCRLISQSHFIPFFLGLPLGRTFCFNIVCLAVGKASSLRSECCYADGSWCNWSLQVGTIAISIKIQNGLTFWAFWHWLTGLSRNIPPPCFSTWFFQPKRQTFLWHYYDKFNYLSEPKIWQPLCVLQ